MKLLKPSWVTHNGHPIFSVDIHPDGSRFATGGQGSDAGQICVWNMAPVIKPEDEQNEAVPKLLCQMDNHLACVNCVRWSCSGRFLASGGDDKIIMIWQIARYGGTTSIFGGGSKIANVEHWKCVSTLRGHSGDVLDLSWSPHDMWLASCSVDNTVVIWNAKRWQEIVTVLKGHTALVKGVSWDPIGKYVASQSDDKSLRVWRTHDWQQECMITEPFSECGGTTHILRLCWSPDGQYLVSAHAMNNSGPTAQIVERDGWKTVKDFVGHRKAVTCVRFNPHILAKPCEETGKVKNFCCCAIGSRDRSLSVWMTCLKRPLVVLHDLFSNSVLDVSWSQTGSQILVCSWDGTVAYIEFDEEELGRPISPEEKTSWHQKLYGKGLANMSPSNNQRNLVSSLLIENPDILKVQEEQQKMQQQQQQQDQQKEPSREVNGVATSQPALTSSIVQTCSRDSNSRHSLHLKGPTDKQIETRMPDGRRRITPLYIPPDPDTGDVPMPFNSQALPNFSSSTESKSKIVIEKRTETCDVPPVTTVTTSVAVDRSQDKTPQPKEITSINMQGQEKETPGHAAASVSAPVSEIKTEKVPPPKQSVPSTEHNQVPPSSAKRKATDVTPIGRPAEKKRGRPPLSQSLHHQQAKAEKAIAEKEAQRAEVPTVPSSCVSQPQLLFPPLQQAMPSVVKVGMEESGAIRSIQLHVDIPVPGSRMVSKVKCCAEETVFWEHLVSGRGVALSANRQYSCVACEDRTLTVLASTTGRRLLPPLVLPSGASHLHCKGSCALVVTTTGSLHVWNLDELICTVRDESVNVLFRDTPGATIKCSSITDEGLPLLTLSTGKTYLYSKDLSSWLQMTSPDDAIVQCSDHYASMPAMDVFNGSSLPLGSLQHSLFKGPKAAKSVFHTGPSLQQAGTLSFLDAQVSAAHQLRSSKEYKFWLLTLVKYLATEGIEGRLKDLCSQLLGPIGTPCHTWKQHILGLNKRELLREILPVMATNLRLQRLFSEFKDQLDMASNTLPPNG